MWLLVHEERADAGSYDYSGEYDPVDVDEEEGELEDFTVSLLRPSPTTACRMHANETTVEATNINLWHRMCIVLGRCPAAITLKNVTVKGAPLDCFSQCCVFLFDSAKPCS